MENFEEEFDRKREIKIQANGGEEQSENGEAETPINKK